MGSNQSIKNSRITRNPIRLSPLAKVDINAFQTYNYQDNWNKENKGNLVTIAETYISPLNLFSGTDQAGKAKYQSVDDLPKGAQIAIQNDATNASRALFVLQGAGLITLNVSSDKLASQANIVENKKTLLLKSQMPVKQRVHLNRLMQLLSTITMPSLLNQTISHHYIKKRRTKMPSSGLIS